jgi:tetratricopeptide (TPR) repeat protein
VHLDENEIDAFVAGGLSDAQGKHVRSHLDTCAECLALVAAVIKQRGLGELPTLAQGSAPESSASLAKNRPSNRIQLTAGATVGTYVIERFLGGGGMGVVYAARDPRLDRTVALKLIRQGSGVSREELGKRLERESKALARLSHPNVTAVYDVGTDGDHVFIAMEYVAGKTLRAWLEEPRSTRDILLTFMRAGRGLVAAHAADLVHRDFKPDNVLVGQGDIVKVTDFGLARIAVDVFATDGNSLALRPTDPNLTATGAFLGTPAYMAPEQFDEGAVDARADQFSFCVALYEALYGERPFKGATIAALEAAIEEGKVEPRLTARVPLRIRRALIRGLSAEPSARFSSMGTLLAALGPRRGRATLAVAGVAAVWGVAITAVVLPSRTQPTPCQGAGAEIEAVWNSGRRASVRAAFVATNLPHAAETASAIEKGLDTYVADWSAMQRESCEATRVKRLQSEAVFDLRAGCLGRRRSELEALVTVLSRPDREIVGHAREALSSIDLSSCADAEALARRSPLPTEPAERAKYDALRTRLARARVLVDVAHFADAISELDAIDTTPFAVLDAESLMLRGKALAVLGKFDEAEKASFNALSRAQASRELDMVAIAAIDLAYAVGYRGQQAKEGEQWIELASSTIAAQGGNDALTARLLTVQATILERDGKLAEAEQAERKALDLARKKAPDQPLEGEVLDALGANLAMQGKLDEAIPLLEKSLSIRQARYGEVHLLTASTRMNLGNALSTKGRRDEARVHLEKVVTTYEELFGPEGFKVSFALGNLGQLLQETKQLAEARRVLERALAIREKELGPEHPKVARMVANLGYVALDAKDYKRAIALFQRTGAIMDKAFDPTHPARIDVLSGEGAAWLGDGRPADAITPLERAVNLREAHPSDPVELAELRALYAQALWRSGRDKARAKKLAAEARAVLAAAGVTEAVDGIDAWLK